MKRKTERIKETKRAQMRTKRNIIIMKEKKNRERQKEHNHNKGKKIKQREPNII